MGLLSSVKNSVLGEDRLRVEYTTDSDVPQFLHFLGIRRMPIAQLDSNLNRVLFSSPESYERYKHVGKLTRELLDDPDGLGIPLMRMEDVEEAYFSGKSELVRNVYLFYRCAIDDTPPFEHFRQVLHNEKIALYKCLYCRVFRTNTSAGTNYTLHFMQTGDEIPMYHRFRHRDMDTRIEGATFRWHVKYAPLIENDHYKLALLNPDVPSLLDYDLTGARSPEMHPDAKYRLMCAHYFSDDADFLPRNVLKVADLTVGETEQVPSPGITKVPELTMVFACQALLINALELDKATGAVPISAPFNTPFLV